MTTIQERLEELSVSTDPLETEAKWDLGEAEEKDAVSFLLEHPSAWDYLEYLGPDSFNKIEYQYIAAVIRKFYDEHGTVPTRAVLSDIIKRNFTVDDSGVADVMEVVMHRGDPRNYGHILSKLQQWIQYRKYRKLYDQETIVAVNKGDYSVVEQIITDAADVKLANRQPALGELYESIFDVDASDPVPLGIDVPGIQLRRGQVLAWAAPTNFGKSTFLVHNAATLIQAGKRVLFISAEMTGRDVMKKLVANALGVSCVSTYSKAVKEKVEEWQDRLRIHKAETEALSARGIASVYDRYLQREQFHADVIVIDYLELLAPTRRSRDEKTYEKQRDIATQLLGLAGSKMVAVITATQTNREGEHKKEQKKLIGLSDLADSYGKAMPMDYIVTLTQAPVTFDKASLKMISGYVAKNRHGMMGGHFKVVMNGEASKLMMYDAGNPKWNKLIKTNELEA